MPQSQQTVDVTCVINFPRGRKGIFFGHSDMSSTPNLPQQITSCTWMLPKGLKSLHLPIPVTYQAALGHDVFVLLL